MKLESFKNAAYKKQSNFLLATSPESCSLSEPEAVFLGLANTGNPSAFLCLLSSLKAELGKITSPLTSIFLGKSPINLSGIEDMVLMLLVTTSPVVPSPLVTALISSPSS